MDINTFKKKIKEKLKEAPEQSKFMETRKIFEGVASAIAELYQEKKLKIIVELGHSTNLGQQLNMVALIDAVRYRDVLFRAYVPMDGFPVSLDFFGDEIIACQDENELERQILNFLQNIDVAQRIRNLAEQSDFYNNS